MSKQAPTPKAADVEQPTDETACSRLADYLESPPPYRKHCTKEKLWLVLDAHGDSLLWSDQELATDAAVEALNEITMQRETYEPATPPARCVRCRQNLATVKNSLCGTCALRGVESINPSLL